MGVTRESSERVLALAGNPNVGKSTLFNTLTGLHQHTGNWPGKTVGSAYGYTELGDGDTHVVVADLPGTYSLLARSEEEAVARDRLLFGEATWVLVVCDATALRRQLTLVRQIQEITPSVLVCVNLLDEAKKRGLTLDLPALSRALGAPVIGMSAGRGMGYSELRAALRDFTPAACQPIIYDVEIEEILAPLCAYLQGRTGHLPPHFVAARLAEAESLCDRTRSAEADMAGCLLEHLPLDNSTRTQLLTLWREARAALQERGIVLSDETARRQRCACEALYEIAAPQAARSRPAGLGYAVDRVLTHRLCAVPLMLLLLAGVLWLSLVGANAPSELLSRWLFALGERLRAGFHYLNLPANLQSLVCDGVYRTLAWVVSVMLPPMAIFFPLFTMLEDLGLLPRLAFNLDGLFRRCGACGKQGLTMCMGFGCNAAGVVGCQIIDAPRERMIAILTNSFVPCNGRFPTMMALILLFLTAKQLPATLLLTGLIVLGVAMTLLVSRWLSQTVLRGLPSSFALELPPYRVPKFGEVLVRSVLDRTVFVLGRAVTAAAPAGLLIWFLGRWQIHGVSALTHLCQLLEGPGALFGMDGAILLAFVLGLPANEIVLPALIMCYANLGQLQGYASLHELQTLLLQNGWTTCTGVCVLLFMLLHWPCATTLLSIYSQTKSLKYTALAAALPTVCGLALCAVVHALWIIIY